MNEIRFWTIVEKAYRTNYYLVLCHIVRRTKTIVNFIYNRIPSAAEQIKA